MAHKQISDNWERGDPYEQYIGRWSRQVAPRFLDWLSCPTGLRWLDIGCGTGTLCSAIVDRASPAMAVGGEPSAGFLRTARTNLAGRAAFYQGMGTAIPLASGSVDMVVSGLVLNFIPDQPAAVKEMARVTRGGGLIGAYVWDYAGKMELIRRFWDAAVELDPAAVNLDEGVRFPICQPEALKELFAWAGLTGIEVTAIDVPTIFASFEDFWQPFLGGQGPAPAYLATLNAHARAGLQDRLLERLPIKPDGSIALIARGWAIKAAVPK